MITLSADASWCTLTESDRAQVLRQVGLAAPGTAAIKTDSDLLGELDRQSLEARASAVAAVPERVARALQEAARRVKPGARRIALRPATLETEEQVRAWLSEHEKKLIEAVRKGPVVVG